MVQKICPQCGKLFSVKDTRTKFCSRHCFHNSRRIIKNTSCSDSRLYRIWRGMIKRCMDPKVKDFKNYGAKNISVCEQWLNDFHCFESWSLQNGYEDHLSIDRINTDGNYEPTNCRWATYTTQNNNRHINIFLQYNGRTLTIAQWAHELNMTYAIIRSRYLKGWDVETIFTTPIRKKKINNNHKIEFDGQCLSRVGWDEYLGFPRGTVSNRLRNGMSVQKALTLPIQKQFSPKKK